VETKKKKEQLRMTTIGNSMKKIDAKMLISTLWIFLSANYIYRDILSNMEPVTLQGYLAGKIGDISITQSFLLAGAIMMELPFAMILLSRVLKGAANRWVNSIVAILMIVIEIGTMGIGTTPTLHYLFYTVIVIACTLSIIWFAWKLYNPKAEY
jgi:hypothetical protein